MENRLADGFVIFLIVPYIINIDNIKLGTYNISHHMNRIKLNFYKYEIRHIKNK